jgi:hypothetical protein
MAVTLPVVLTELTPILLLVDRGDLGHHGLNKAMLLARHLQAPLEMYLCDVSPSATAPDSPQRLAELAQKQAAAQAYLQALRQGISSTDVEIRCESRVASSVAEGLDQRLRRGAALLVIAPAGAQLVPDPRVGLERSLLQCCIVPLLLTRRRAWRPVPQFGAAIDLDVDADPRLGARLVGLAERLTRRCEALLEYLYVGRGETEAEAARAAWRRLTQLADAAEDRSGLKGWLRYHHGQPREVLPGVVSERGYDLLMMGWPRRPDGAPEGFIDDDAASSAPGRTLAKPRTPLESRRTSVRLLQAAAGDLLLLPARPDIN